MTKLSLFAQLALFALVIPVAVATPANVVFVGGPGGREGHHTLSRVADALEAL